MTNEEKVEETTETNDELETEEETQEEYTSEETNEEENEEIEEEADDSPTLEDYEKLKKERETLLAQKEHWRKKATQVKPKEPVTNKTNTEPVNQSEIIELSRLAARGYSDEDIELLKDIKTLKGLKSFSEAVDTPLFKANKEQRELEAKKEKAQLPASGKTLFKAGKEPTKEDMKKAWLGK